MMQRLLISILVWVCVVGIVLSLKLSGTIAPVAFLASSLPVHFRIMGIGMVLASIGMIVVFIGLTWAMVVDG